MENCPVVNWKMCEFFPTSGQGCDFEATLLTSFILYLMYSERHWKTCCQLKFDPLWKIEMGEKAEIQFHTKENPRYLRYHSLNILKLWILTLCDGKIIEHNVEDKNESSGGEHSLLKTYLSSECSLYYGNGKMFNH